MIFFKKKVRVPKFDLNHLKVSATGPDGPPAFKTLTASLPYNLGRIMTVVAYYKSSSFSL